MRRPILAMFLLGQSAVLAVAGAVTIGSSQTLMTVLIAWVGEEQALGADNVIRLPGGGKLLTNPGAMVAWTLPFFVLGIVQLSAAATLVRAWARWDAPRPGNRPRSADPAARPT